MNIGARPTFADGAGDTVEVHVMHPFGRQFYGEELRVARRPDPPHEPPALSTPPREAALGPLAAPLCALLRLRCASRCASLRFAADVARAQPGLRGPGPQVVTGFIRPELRFPGLDALVVRRPTLFPARCSLGSRARRASPPLCAVRLLRAGGAAAAVASAGPDPDGRRARAERPHGAGDGGVRRGPVPRVQVSPLDGEGAGAAVAAGGVPR